MDFIKKPTAIPHYVLQFDTEEDFEAAAEQISKNGYDRTKYLDALQIEVFGRGKSAPDTTDAILEELGLK